MAKKTSRDDTLGPEIVLYGIPVAFQNRLLKFLVKRAGTILIAVDVNGNFSVEQSDKSATSDSLELALNTVMHSAAKHRKSFPKKLEAALRTLLAERAAVMGIAARETPDGLGFDVDILAGTGPTKARGREADIDLEIAIWLAADRFLESVGSGGTPRPDLAELEEALVPAAAREADEEDRHEALRRAFMEPRAELLENRRTGAYAAWLERVDEILELMGTDTSQAANEYWRMLFSTGMTPEQAVEEYGHELAARGQWLRRNAAVSASARPRLPPRRSRKDYDRAAVARLARPYDEKPFDPEAPREHYARPHHFAVNADAKRGLAAGPGQWRVGDNGFHCRIVAEQFAEDMYEPGQVDIEWVSLDE